MLGYEPKDFDIVTDAHPEEIVRIFRSARLIGRRFKLVHVRFGRDVIEVATYRGLPSMTDDEFKTESGRLLRDNVFGTQEQDALRRDITVNALYYDIRDFSVIDYVGGVEDLHRGVLRMIGEPETRFREDPVRMLRILRFAAKLGFRLEARTEAPIRKLSSHMDDVPPARRFEEVLKLFHSGKAVDTFELLRRYDLFRYLFPLTDESLSIADSGYSTIFVPSALRNTDSRIEEGKPVTPAFLFAVMLWDPVCRHMASHVDKGMSPADALRQASQEVLGIQSSYTSVPRRFSVPMREIWSLQNRFARRRGKMAFRLLEHERFRAAYDFLLLRTESGELEADLADWWTEFQEQDEEGRRTMVRAQSGDPKPKRRRRSRGKKK